MRPIGIFWSSDISEEEVRLATAAVIDTVKHLPETVEVSINHFGNWSQGKGPYQSLDWYERRAWLGGRNQLNAGSIVDGFRDLQVGRGIHSFLILVGRDITCKDEKGNWYSFLFGLSDGELVGVVSSYRFNRYLEDRKLRRLCFRRAVQHEFLHVLGLFSEEHEKWRTTNVDNRLGTHCANVCVMRQGESVQEWLEETLEEKRRGVILCRQCQEDLLTLLGLRVAS